MPSFAYRVDRRVLGLILAAVPCRRPHRPLTNFLGYCFGAGLPTVAAICEVMGPDGHMLTGSAVERFALNWGLPLIAVNELAACC